MRHIVDPRQKLLFDPAESQFSPVAVSRLREDWPGLFRTNLLHLMPVRELGEHFHPQLGCPTKELYSMAGAIFLKEYFNLTIEEAVERYLFDARWHYALNVAPAEASLSHATVERYQRLFAESDLAGEIFERVTAGLIGLLDVDVSRQRLDSTHVFSDMAQFGRTRLMGVAIKRLLTQVKRHDRALYEALPEAFRARYAPSQSRLFADFDGVRQRLRQEVAEDLLAVVNRFAEVAEVSRRSSYQAARRILEEQCIVSEDRTALTVRAKTGGAVQQNPSDPDATYDHHKGPGYQAQIAETCGQANDVQLITAVAVEPAHQSDQDALEPMLEELARHGRKPELMYTDAGYGSDENVTAAGERGVDLQSPIPGVPPQTEDQLTVDDFVVEERRETVQRCPAGVAPVSSVYDAEKGRTVTVMPAEACGNCPDRAQCPVRQSRGRYVLRHTPSQRRLAGRRAEQATEAFREHYRIRSGGESVNSGLKRKTGLGRVRTRGRPRVTMAVLLRCAGWNLWRALAALKKRGIRDFAALASPFLRVLVDSARRLASLGRLPAA